MKYARIVKLFAERAHLPYEDALDFFYASDIYCLMNEGIADMHCLGDEYLADEVFIAWQAQSKIVFSQKKNGKSEE